MVTYVGFCKFEATRALRLGDDVHDLATHMEIEKLWSEGVAMYT